MGQRRRFLLLPLHLLLLALFALSVSAKDTYYDVLELDRDATLSDVKKAYRRLAMAHHPDRNKGREEEATLKFREVSEAYEVLSDEGRRREYDAMLRSGGAGGRGARFEWGGRGGPRRPRDPFAQFDDLFRNDPFFAEAFRDMDDLFAKTFRGGGDGGGGSGARTDGRTKERKGWGEWIGGKVMDALGADVNINVQTNVGGRRSASTYSHSSGRRTDFGGRSTYTSRSTRTIIENGRRVTIQSLEKDGNRIEEKYEGTKLVERRINGVVQEDIGRIEEF